MKEFIIGRNGNQPFKIEAEGVSSEHARITIDDNGQWILEDLHSSNGTFVRDDKGNFTRIVKVHITEQTIISLAHVSTIGHKSFTFMAHHVLEKNPDNYSYEFNLIYSKAEKLRQEEEEVNKKMFRYRYLSIVAPLVGYGISYLPPFKNDFNLIRMSMLLPPMLVNLLLTSVMSKPRELLKLRKATINCPKCGKPLSDYDVDNRQCSICKAQ